MSAVRFADWSDINVTFPAINRWAIFVRPLRGLNSFLLNSIGCRCSRTKHQELLLRPNLDRRAGHRLTGDRIVGPHLLDKCIDWLFYVTNERPGIHADPQ